MAAKFVQPSCHVCGATATITHQPHCSLSGLPEHWNIAKLEAEIARLHDWKRIIDNAPGEARDIAIQRFHEAESMQPIINVWRHKLAIAERERDEAREALSALWKVHGCTEYDPITGAPDECRECQEARRIVVEKAGMLKGSE